MSITIEGAIQGGKYLGAKQGFLISLAVRHKDKQYNQEKIETVDIIVTNAIWFDLCEAFMKDKVPKTIRRESELFDAQITLIKNKKVSISFG